MPNTHATSIPAWTIFVPAIALIVLALKFVGLIPGTAAPVLALSAVLLGASVFAAVHHAEVLALKLGEPFGSILLAVAVTVIEVALIVSIMLVGAPGSENVARDTIFATVMIVLNGVIGLCLVLGASRHFEQTFQLQGASSALGVLGTLATVTLILPNYTASASGPSFSTLQLLFVALMSLVLWCIFVFVQTVKHRAYFLDDGGEPGHGGDAAAGDGEVETGGRSDTELPSDRIAIASVVLLMAALTGVVLLAKVLSLPLERVISSAGLPQAFIGVVIAAIVLLPEGMAAVKSALVNRLQNSINLSIGSAIASIGLTIPAVAVVSVALGQHITLGISAANVTLLVMTLFVSTLTLGTGRTSVLHGAIHLVIFFVFLLISAVP